MIEFIANGKMTSTAGRIDRDYNSNGIEDFKLIQAE